MVESAPLLREYTLIAYRGFESLSLRHTQKTASQKRGFFLGMAEREGTESPRGSTNCKAVWTASGAPKGSWRERQSRHESIPPASSIVIEVSGFFWSGGERCLTRTLRFDKSRKRFGPKNAPAFSAYGTSLCLTASGAPEGGGQDARCRRKMLLHFRHSAHPCALSRS